MIQRLRNCIADKRVLLLGFGREGKSTYRMLQRAGGYAALAVADQAARDPSLDPEIRWFTGPDYQKAMSQFDVVFKSPGIVLEQESLGYPCRITSQTQEFFTCYRQQIIGITGTKGKSTTTTLIYHILKENGVSCLLAGNIGIPVFDVADQVKAETVIVCELSSHQLEYMTVSPQTAVLMNIHEEHLDHYGTMERYIAAKQNVYLYQQRGDLLICNGENLPEETENCGKLLAMYGMEPGQGETGFTSGSGEKPAGRRNPDRMIRVEHTTVFEDGRTYQIPLERMKLVGEHNCFDIGIAYVLCRLRGIPDADITNALCSYEPLPHRLQYVGCHGGVKYYDDSISTICDTAIQALHSVRDVNTILIGGMDRGIDYQDLIRAFYDFPDVHIILMEATGKRIFEEIMTVYSGFPGPDRLHLTGHLREAVELAAAITAPGRSCILSPAAASYGIFKNFEERGEVFQALVKELDVR